MPPRSIDKDDNANNVCEHHRPLPVHSLAFVPDFERESFERFEGAALGEWGLSMADNPYGDGPQPWRDHLIRNWNEVVDSTSEGRTTPLRFAILKHTVRPPPPNERDGILGRQIAKASFLASNPDVLDIDIEPIIIIGPNRTGSTFLHRLLSLDEDARSPKGWELTSPVPPPERSSYDVDQREAKAREDSKSTEEFLPDLKYYHDLDMTKPEECLFGMGNDMVDMGHCINTPGSAMDRLFDSAEMESVYVSHKQTLQILSSRFPARSHWVLKCPSHLPHLELLVRLFPRAKFIWTHRSMETVIPSMCRLNSVFATTSLASVTPAELGRHAIKYYTELTGRGMRQRDAIDDDTRFLDVMFEELVDCPIGQVRRIYDHFNLTFTDEFEARLNDFLRRDDTSRSDLRMNAPPKPTLEEYVLDSTRITESFAAYNERFLNR